MGSQLIRGKYLNFQSGGFGLIQVLPVVSKEVTSNFLQ